MPPQRPINLPVFSTSLFGIIALVAWAFFGHDSAEAALNAITGLIAEKLGWFYVLTATIAVVFVIVVAISKMGTLRLGPDDSRPQFTLFSWSAMLFAAGIGVDLMFFSVAEPVTQYYFPPQGGGETQQAAEDAVVFALFHYGISGWAMYSLLGMAFGFFAFRCNMPLTLRSALYPLFGKRVHGTFGHSVDVAATLGTVFGIAASLGIGVVQLNYGLTLLFGWEEGPRVQTALIIFSVVIASISAVSGVDRGIKRLSELNILFALILMTYVVLAGKTAFLLDALVMNLGDYAANFVDWTLDTYAYSETPDHTRSWLAGWTLFFWAWWVAWAPFVGLFLARISRGRTLREFVLGTLTIPFLFILMWMSFFGNAALDRVRAGDETFGMMSVETPQRGFYELLLNYPGGMWLVGLTTIIGLLLYITSADSGALVMSNFTSRIEDARRDGPRWSRITWSIVIGLLTLVMLRIDGVATAQAATIVMGLPFTLVMYPLMISLWKSLRREIEPVRPIDWRHRIARSFDWPSAGKAQRYLDDVALPALNDVATELSQHFPAHVTAEGFPATLTLHFGEKSLSIVPVQGDIPALAGYSLDREDPYYELHLDDIDIYGFETEELISVILDRVEAERGV
ncbi:MAG: choline BCCT transporter BetT [Corynebacterium sp.]|nr:choline BCCT transporter BetT [Corynebacterium sp.]